MNTIDCPIDNMSIGFPLYPDDCDKITFYQKDKVFTLTNEMLIKDPRKALSSLATYFVLNDKDKCCVIHINKRDTLRIELSGDAVIFYRDESEDFYWDNQELRDAPEEVLGAICGHLTTVKNNPFEDNKPFLLSKGYARLGYQVINQKGDTYGLDKNFIFKEFNNLYSALSSARVDYPDLRWMINTVFDDSEMKYKIADNHPVFMGQR